MLISHQGGFGNVPGSDLPLIVTNVFLHCRLGCLEVLHTVTERNIKKCCITQQDRQLWRWVRPNGLNPKNYRYPELTLATRQLYVATGKDQVIFIHMELLESAAINETGRCHHLALLGHDLDTTHLLFKTWPKFTLHWPLGTNASRNMSKNMLKGQWTSCDLQESISFI